MTLDHTTAAPRTDLPWLRRRTKRLQPSANPALQDFIGGRTHGEHHHASSSGSLDLDAPAPPTRPATIPLPPASSSLDLDAPAPPPPPAPPSTSSLDLDTPAPMPPPAVATSSSDLDLGSSDEAPLIPPPSSSAKHLPPPRRAVTGRQSILSAADPTLNLTRLQSGVGTLTIEAACSAEVGDLRLGCAFELASGSTSTVQVEGGNRTGGPDPRRPVLLAHRERFETVTVDLRQVRDLSRLAVFVFSQDRQPLRWGGTLLVRTFGGATVEVPLDLTGAGHVGMLLTAYQVGGELVLRSALHAFDSSVRDACRAYGYDRIAWLDDRTPVH